MPALHADRRLTSWTRMFEQAVDGVEKRVDREAHVAEEEVVAETWRTSMFTWITSVTLRMYEDCGMNEKCTEMMIESFLSRDAGVGVDAVAEHRDAVGLAYPYPCKTLVAARG